MTQTRKLCCENPKCPHEKSLLFNDWVRLNLPDSATGFLATDLDFILYNWKTKQVMLLEIKTHSSEPKYWQRRIFTKLNECIDQGITEDWHYRGFNLITFEKTSFVDGRCWLNKKEVTEEELIKFLSMN